MLNGTQITDRGVENLGHLSKLGWFELEWTDIGDEGIHHLKHLTQSTTLRISGTRVSRSGIESISNLSSSLDELWIERTNVTDEEIRLIKLNRPTTTIVGGGEVLR